MVKLREAQSSCPHVPLSANSRILNSDNILSETFHFALLQLQTVRSIENDGSLSMP